MSETAIPASPVRLIPTDDAAAQPQKGIGLCLSGGGYRAMLFHLGSLRRLYETGYLRELDRISSVSGGSITAAVLGMNWKDLMLEPAVDLARFDRYVVQPIRGMADETIDADAVIFGIALPGSISDRIQDAYARYLYGKATLQDLPDTPRFVINATNVQSGVLWRFMKPSMVDYRVGKVEKPATPLALAVTASSAFPPVLSPVEMRLDPNTVQATEGADLNRKPFTSKVVLTDGGVYDNLGLETVWKNYDTVLVSDGGGKMQAEEEPKTDWARHALRVLDVIDNQVRSLRKRQVIDSYKSGTRKGTYWGIRTNIADYGLDSLPCPFADTTRLAETPTRLKRIDDLLQEKLINWGYAVCDAGLRKHVDPTLPKPASFPYPTAGV